MKKTYNSPQWQTVTLSCAEIITLSGDALIQEEFGDGDIVFEW